MQNSIFTQSENDIDQERYESEKKNKVEHEKEKSKLKQAHLNEKNKQNVKSIFSEYKSEQKEENSNCENGSKEIRRKKKTLKLPFDINLFLRENEYGEKEDEIWRLYKQINSDDHLKKYCFDKNEKIREKEREEREKLSFKKVIVQKQKKKKKEYIDVKTEFVSNEINSENIPLRKLFSEERKAKSVDIVKDLNLLLCNFHKFTNKIYPYNESLSSFCNRMKKISINSSMWIDYRHELLLKYKNTLKNNDFEDKENNEVGNDVFRNGKNYFKESISNAFQNYFNELKGDKMINEEINQNKLNFDEFVHDFYDDENIFLEKEYDFLRKDKNKEKSVIEQSRFKNIIEEKEITLEVPPDISSNSHLLDEIEERRKRAILKKQKKYNDAKKL